MQRDFFYEEDDNFQIALSPFNDKRNGYLFVVNPNGARADALISGNESANKDWNGECGMLEQLIQQKDGLLK